MLSLRTAGRSLENQNYKSRLNCSALHCSAAPERMGGNYFKMQIKYKEVGRQLAGRWTGGARKEKNLNLYEISFDKFAVSGDH